MRHRRRRDGSKGPRFLESDAAAPTSQLLWDWLQRRVIQEPVYREGCRFANEVRSMHEPCLSAMPLVKVRVDTSYRPTRHLQGGSSAASQDAVYEALRSVGGEESQTASVLLHVVGLDWSLRRWCQAAGMKVDNGNLRFAAGLLVGALTALAAKRAENRAENRARKEEA